MFKKIAGLVVAVSPLSAFAAVPAAVDTALTAMSADVTTVGVAFVVAVIGLKALHLLKRA